ncbi:MAG: hypothetical protein HRT47_01835 [Candidatus Caenarcaniphilales bacterium]|nr:hypothetical protein [Candidatus Caenarcaniphilales bacterium]
MKKRNKTVTLILGRGFSESLFGLPSNLRLSREIFKSYENLCEYQYWLTGIGSLSMLEVSNRRRFLQSDFLTCQYEPYDLLSPINKKKYEKMFYSNSTSVGTFNRFRSSLIETLYSQLSLKTRRFDSRKCDEFIMMLESFIDKGHTVNIFDLNLDLGVETLIKSSDFSSKYEDGFGEVFDDYTPGVPPGCSKFEGFSSNKLIHHYKPNGSLRFLHEVADTVFKLTNEGMESEFYTPNTLSRTHNAICPPVNERFQLSENYEYYSYTYKKLLESMIDQNDLILFDYNFGDTYLNSLLSNLYDIKTDEYEVGELIVKTKSRSVKNTLKSLQFDNQSLLLC